MRTDTTRQKRHAALGALIGAAIATVTMTAGCGAGEDIRKLQADSAAATVAERPMPGPPPEGATAALVAMGDSVFHGEVGGGLCATCHGIDARGTATGSSLVDQPWRTGDGGYAFLQRRVTEGVPQPAPPFTAPMPPMGGAQLTMQQVQAVAAYTFSISRGKR